MGLKNSIVFGFVVWLRLIFSSVCFLWLLSRLVIVRWGFELLMDLILNSEGLVLMVVLRMFCLVLFFQCFVLRYCFVVVVLFWWYLYSVNLKWVVIWDLNLQVRFSLLNLMFSLDVVFMISFWLEYVLRMLLFNCVLIF